MASRVEVGGLRIDERLYRLVREEIAPGTGVEKLARQVGERVLEVRQLDRVRHHQRRCGDRDRHHEEDPLHRH